VEANSGNPNFPYLEGAQMKLNGRTAVVTGGGRGIGRAYCERLAADGANVVVLDIDDATPVVDALGGSGDKTAMICDVSKPEQITAVANAVLERFGRCDIFVNNAAVFPVTDLKTVTLDVWRRVQAVNVEPLLLFAQAFVPGMAEGHWGRIVSTGSSVTLSQQQHDLAYVTSKGSIHAFVRALANDLGEMGITVNAIAPTIVKTEGLVARTPAGGPTVDEIVKLVVSQQTIKRASTPTDAANALSFLVSDDAAFITGQILHVDGGFSRSGA
jgi:NAD(P)-dependent dehydrogenase (short-subunit alcohol dehydrogenase family)